MSENNRFNETIDTLGSAIEKIGWKDYEMRQPEKGDDRRVQLHILPDAEDTSIFVEGFPESEVFFFKYHYDLIQGIANRLRESGNAEEYIMGKYQEEDWEENYDTATLAALSIVDSLDYEDNEELLFQLTETAYNNPIAIRTFDSPGGHITSFLVWKLFFPYEDDFSINTFYQTISEVTASGNRAQTFLRYAFNLGIEDDKEASELSKEVVTTPEFPH